MRFPACVSGALGVVASGVRCPAGLEPAALAGVFGLRAVCGVARLTEKKKPAGGEPTGRRATRCRTATGEARLGRRLPLGMELQVDDVGAVHSLERSVGAIDELACYMRSRLKRFKVRRRNVRQVTAVLQAGEECDPVAGQGFWLRRVGRCWEIGNARRNSKRACRQNARRRGQRPN